LAKVRADGWEPVDLGQIEDDESSLVEAFGRGGATCDAVVATGGVSVGDRDLVKVALDEATGGASRSVQIAVKPAKPFAFGILASSGVPAFGLPGNPVSAFVAYEVLVRPALRAMSGCTTLDRPLIPAMAAGDFIRRPDGKIHFVRAVVTAGGDGVLRALPLGSAGPHLLRTMANANALAVLPDGPTVAAGQRVELLLLDADRLNDPPGSHW
jgi:molybdenum cofactor synthesis domain-containing protein